MERTQTGDDEVLVLVPLVCDIKINLYITTTTIKIMFCFFILISCTESDGGGDGVDGDSDGDESSPGASSGEKLSPQIPSLTVIHGELGGVGADLGKIKLDLKHDSDENQDRHRQGSEEGEEDLLDV